LLAENVQNIYLNLNLPVGKINYTVWSDVFICSECSNEIVFWDASVDQEVGELRDRLTCPHCDARLKKNGLERSWSTIFDSLIGKNIKQAKQVPVLINYNYGKKRFEKSPDIFDLALIDKISHMELGLYHRFGHKGASSRGEGLAKTWGYTGL
jgi:DNA-directed RNA polymerase subunit RPC12/RpoP